MSEPPEDIIAEMRRAVIHVMAEAIRQGTYDDRIADPIARACWAVIEKRMGWRPIETAPKTASRSNKVDLWLVVGDTRMRVADCWYDNDLGGWANYAIGNERLLNQSAITHWQPPYPPPSSAEEGR